MLSDSLTITPTLDEIIEHENEISKDTKSASTKAGYKGDFSRFVDWCESVHLDALPAHPNTVRLYLAYLDKIGRKPSTIKRAITSIRQAHVLSEHENPITDVVKETCKGIYRRQGVLVTKKSALTVDKLDRILRFVDEGFLGVRDRAILLVGWTGALRRSEVVGINYEDIEQQAEGLAITIRRSKTDQIGAGRRIGLPYVDENEDLCAARALIRWIKEANITSGAIFRQIGKAGRTKSYVRTGNRLSDKQVARMVKRYAERAGYNPAEFGGHSLRSGLATTLASIGIEERRIMQITGHKSLPILREYIQRGELFSDHPVLSVFRR